MYFTFHPINFKRKPIKLYHDESKKKCMREREREEQIARLLTNRFYLLSDYISSDRNCTEYEPPRSRPRTNFPPRIVYQSLPSSCFITIADIWGVTKSVRCVGCGGGDIDKQWKK